MLYEVITPPRTHIAQTDANSTCAAVGNVTLFTDETTSTTLSTKRLPTRKEQIVFSDWESDTNAANKEAGTLVSSSSCNTKGVITSYSIHYTKLYDSILVIFMVQYLMMDKAESTTLYHLFAGACYLIPVLGAYLSDRFLGKYKTILSLSLVYCLGNVLLACMGMDMDTGSRQTLLYWGLGLVALGTGGIKPCVSAFVGDQFKKDQEEELRQSYNFV